MTNPRSVAMAAWLAAAAMPLSAAAADVPAAFHGTWVRADAACGAPLALIIEARRVTFRNGARNQSYSKLEVCKACNHPSDRSGTVQVLADAPDGSPFLLYLTPGAPPFVTMNWRPLEDALPRRYPLAPEPLKKCPG